MHALFDTTCIMTPPIRKTRLQPQLTRRDRIMATLYEATRLKQLEGRRAIQNDTK